VHVRVAPRAHRFGLTVALIFACALPAWAVACGRDADPSDAIDVTWSLDPAPPVTGEPVVARLTLRDTAKRQPVLGAKLRLEGHMSHPGMAPVITDLIERGDGTYETRLQFTMAGDWVLRLVGELPGGARLTKQIEIAGVRPAP
jgi:hypothetical protein